MSELRREAFRTPVVAASSVVLSRGSSKGVFVTTSYFSKSAKTFAERIPQRIILINGATLVRLMLQYDVGVRIVRTVRLKRTDLDYFEQDVDG